MEKQKIDSKTDQTKRKELIVFHKFGSTAQKLIEDIEFIIEQGETENIREYITSEQIELARKDYELIQIFDEKQLYGFMNLINKFVPRYKNKKPNIKKEFIINYKKIDSLTRTEKSFKKSVPLDRSVQQELEKCSDYKFSYRFVPKSTKNLVVKIVESLSRWTPTYSKGFKNTQRYKSGSYISIVEGRVKKARSLQEKIFDLCYALDKIPLKQRKSNKYARQTHKLKEKEINKIHSHCGITDRKALRIITKSEDFMYKIAKEIGNLFGQNYEDYYIMLDQNTGSQRYNSDRLNTDLDGIVEVKDYVKSPKENGYNSIHMLIRYCGSMLELQLRTEAMHKHAEYGEASHYSHKGNCTIRREDFLKQNPLSVQVFSILEEIF